MQVVDNAVLADESAAAVRHRFDRTLRERELIVPGQGAREPAAFLRRYRPECRTTLFDVEFYLSAMRQDNGFGFFVAFVALPKRAGKRHAHRLYARIFYKDSSLIWRSATHYIHSDNEHWVGKGDIRPVLEDGREVWYSAEETTNLPVELVAALDTASRRHADVAEDGDALALVLRNAPDDRVEPYYDFYGPRERAARDSKRLVNGGRPIATFADPGRPESLRFVAGFEPDFRGGRIDVSYSRSSLYGGEVRKYRFLSANRVIQYLILAAPAHVWIIPPQTLEPDIMSYGVREIDVDVPEELCIPGYEYHYIDETVEPPTLHTQIPAGFAGPASQVDPGRADASPWNERLPLVREFRATVLRRDGRPAKG